MKEISPDELRKKISTDEKLIVIDVREWWEYDENNIGVKNIPLGDLPQSLSALPNNKDCEIVVHCQSGRRSQQACKYLHQQGYTNTKSLSGGLEAYLANTD